MKTWVTSIYAKSPIDGEIKEYGGPNVPGINVKDAEKYCEENGLGYCKVIGELICEIPCHQNTYTPNWDKMIDYSLLQMN